jgi:hypothetical protein
MISALAFTTVFMISAAAGAAEETQDWYTWYEQQSARVEEEAAQYYEATSPDQTQSSEPVRDDGAVYEDEYAYDPYAYDDAPDQTQPQAEPIAEEPEWVRSGGEPPVPDQTQAPEQPQEDAPREQPPE